ncbi:MAG: hypothetical protein J0M33_15025 [Anaerolineae bacterium]|nr:hypothetical protein [Anaerolineae bacterium]
MSDSTVTLNLPASLYEKLQQVARQQRRPVEVLMLDSLSLLFEEPSEIVALKPEMLQAFSDEQLWALVYRRLALPQEGRLEELAAKGHAGSLSQSEVEEQAQLITAFDHYVLLRSQALVILKQRGHDVESRLQTGS